MKRLVFVALLASGTLGLHASAFAQSGAPAIPPPAAAPKMKIGGEGAFVLPTGDWADGYGVGLGVMGRLDYMVGPQLAVTAHPGFIYHLPKSMNLLGTTFDVTLKQLLLAGGVRLFVTPEISLSAETGINLLMYTVSAGGQSDSNSENRIPLLLGGSYSAPAGLTVSGYLLMPNLLMTENNEDTQLGFMLTVGYMVGR